MEAADPAEKGGGLRAQPSAFSSRMNFSASLIGGFHIGDEAADVGLADAVGGVELREGAGVEVCFRYLPLGASGKLPAELGV